MASRPFHMNKTMDREDGGNIHKDFFSAISRPNLSPPSPPSCWISKIKTNLSQSFQKINIPLKLGSGTRRATGRFFQRWRHTSSCPPRPTTSAALLHYLSDNLLNCNNRYFQTPVRTLSRTAGTSHRPLKLSRDPWGPSSPSSFRWP